MLFLHYKTPANFRFVSFCFFYKNFNAIDNLKFWSRILSKCNHVLWGLFLCRPFFAERFFFVLVFVTELFHFRINVFETFDCIFKTFLLVFNYYLPFFLKKTLQSTDIFLNTTLTIFSIIGSFCLWKSLCLMKEKFFFMKTSHKKVKFLKSVRDISLSQYTAYWKVSVLKALLSVSWSAVYFSPCIVVVALLIYSYRYENYGMNVNLTLFLSSIVLFFIGLFHFFVTIKRYSMCNAIILRDKQKNPLKVITESIDAMENQLLFALIGVCLLG